MDARGPAGRLARTVKLADLEDHLAHPTIPADAPPYAWARQRLLTARDRAVQAAPMTPSQTRRPAARRNRVASNSPRSGRTPGLPRALRIAGHGAAPGDVRPYAGVAYPSAFALVASDEGAHHRGCELIDRERLALHRASQMPERDQRSDHHRRRVPRLSNQARCPSTNGPSRPGFLRDPDMIHTLPRSRSPHLKGQVGRRTYADSSRGRVAHSEGSPASVSERTVSEGGGHHRSRVPLAERA